jgi:hypothetical protein
MGRPLTLDAGQQVKLITEGGDAIVLKGPYVGSPSQIPAHSPLRTPFATLLPAAALPGAGAAQDPWAIDFDRDRGGSVCVKEGQYVSFHRDDIARDAAFEVRSAGSWKNGSRWKPGERDVTIGTSYPLREGGDYTAWRDDDTTVTIVVISEAPMTDRMRAAWLNLIGCGAQAKLFAARGR